MTNSIALPLNPLEIDSAKVRAFRLNERYGWRETGFYKFNPEIVAWVTNEARRSTFIFPDTQFWTSPLFFPAEWPPELVKEKLLSGGVQRSLF